MGARDLLDRLDDAGITVTAHAGKLVVNPPSRLTDAIRWQLAAAKSDLLAILSAPEPLRSCSKCQHRRRYGTCAEPVAAGLSPSFMLAWPDTHWGEHCTAFAARMKNPH